MTDEAKRKFLVSYLIPSAVVEEWKKTDPETRQAAEQKVMQEWHQWSQDHASITLSTEAGGKTKRVTSSGISDTNNDIMVLSFVEAESLQAAAQIFENHPHLQIMQASIEVMEVKQMGGRLG